MLAAFYYYFDRSITDIPLLPATTSPSASSSASAAAASSSGAPEASTSATVTAPLADETAVNSTAAASSGTANSTATTTSSASAATTSSVYLADTPEDLRCDVDTKNRPEEDVSPFCEPEEGQYVLVGETYDGRTFHSPLLHGLTDVLSDMGSQALHPQQHHHSQPQVRQRHQPQRYLASRPPHQ